METIPSEGPCGTKSVPFWGRGAGVGVRVFASTMLVYWLVMLYLLCPFPISSYVTSPHPHGSAKQNYKQTRFCTIYIKQKKGFGA
jgi:hypothetical protein